MADRLKILVFHNCENLAKARRSTLDFIFSFERYAPEHLYLYHRIMLPLTPEITAGDWDLVLFDSTACGIVTLRPRERFARIREELSFLRASKAVKFAFPQDDASHGGMMDLWFHWMDIDTLYTVRPEKVDLIYPLTKRRAKIASTLAGFIDDSTIRNAGKFRKPFSERQWVAGQRVTQYPAWGGRFARRKGEAALQMKRECDRRGIRNNISTDPADVLLGNAWNEFLGDTQFVVGAEGGHGIWDPYGTIQDSTNEYKSRHPDASFEEIEAACFMGLDGMHSFPGFAPRILEAALAGCAQILLKGHYRGLIKEGEHYIPLADDYSNFDEVFEAMRNTDRVAGMVAATQRDLVENSRFQYRAFVADILRDVESAMRDKPGNAAASAAAPDDKDWLAFQLRHFQSLKAALAMAGIRQERLQEPYLTPWIHRELTGQVTDPAMRAALDLSDEPGTGEAAQVSAKARSAAEQTRTTIVAEAVTAILSVDGSAEAFAPLMAAISLDQSLIEKLRQQDDLSSEQLLRLSLDILTLIGGAADALSPVAAAINADPEGIEKVRQATRNDRPAMLRHAEDVLKAHDGAADMLAPIAALIHADPEGVVKITRATGADRAALLQLSLDIIDAIIGAANAFTPVATAVSSDSVQLAASLKTLDSADLTPDVRAQLTNVFKRHLLVSLGSPPPSLDEAGLAALFDLLISRAESLKDPAAAATLYRVLNAATASRLRGPLIRLIANTSREARSASPPDSIVVSSD